MFFSENEEKIMKNLFEDISKEPHKMYRLEYEDGSILEVKQDTCYETDNGMEEDEEEYQEYYACAMKIISIIRNVELSQDFKEGMLIELNYLNYPKSITDVDGRNI